MLGDVPLEALGERARDEARARRRLRIEGHVVVAPGLEVGAQRRRLERGRVMIEPPAQPRIGRVAEVDAGVVVAVDGDAGEGVAEAVLQADRHDVHAGGVLAVEGAEQRRRGGAVETRVVEEQLEQRSIITPA